MNIEKAGRGKYLRKHKPGDLPGFLFKTQTQPMLSVKKAKEQ
jgi:hypothetical protein